MLLLPFLIYLPLQIYAAVRLKGGWRWMSLIPAVPMAIAVAVSLAALSDNSNLWGLPVALALLPSTAYIVLVLLVHKFVPLRRWVLPGAILFALFGAWDFWSNTRYLVEERRGHGDPSPWLHQLPDSLVTWGMPTIVLALSAVALWRSERERKRTLGTAAPPSGIKA